MKIIKLIRHYVAAYRIKKENQTLKLQDIVFKLRNNGYNIVTEMKKNKSTNTIYAVYKLIV